MLKTIRDNKTTINFNEVSMVIIYYYDNLGIGIIVFKMYLELLNVMIK